MLVEDSRGIMPGVGMRRLGTRVAMAATVAVVLWLGVAGTVAIVDGVRDRGHGKGVGVFNACITHTRFLALVDRASRNGVIETIRDRADHGLVGEVATGRAPVMLGGAAAGNGRYLMSTATPLGRDASAIETCWDRYSPIAPSA